MVKQMLFLESLLKLFHFERKLINSLPNILYFTTITGQKVDQTSFIVIKSLIYYVSLSCHSGGKS